MTADPSTHELLIRIKRGVDAVEILYAQYWEDLITVTRRLRLLESDGEDIIEEFFVKKILPGPEYDEKRGLIAPSAGRAWLMRVFKNQVVDWIKARNRQHKRMPEISLEQLEEVIQRLDQKTEKTFFSGIPKEIVEEALERARDRVNSEDIILILDPRKDGRTAEVRAARQRLHEMFDICLLEIRKNK